MLTQKQRSAQTRRKDAKDKKACIERAGGLCEIRLGGCHGRAVDHHHIRPKSTHPHLRHDPSNLIAVCRFCHDWVERNKRAGLELCEEIKAQ